MKDAIIVGAGIIGCTVAKALYKQKMNILHLADRREHTGTSASAGHMKLEWSGMDAKDYIAALGVMDELWDVYKQDYTFHPNTEATDILRTTTVWRVDIDQVLKFPFSEATVTQLEGVGTKAPLVRYSLNVGNSEARPRHVPCEESCKLLVLATGVWANELLDTPLLADLRAKQGISFRWGAKLRDPGFIQPWAPYKQIVAHQQSPQEVWVGDGTAILAHNWRKERNSECLIRCREALARHTTKMEHNPLRHTIGLRPYLKLPKGEPCLCTKLGPATWLATGAGKNGTIAAGWVANRILGAVK